MNPMFVNGLALGLVELKNPEDGEGAIIILGTPYRYIPVYQQ